MAAQEQRRLPLPAFLVVVALSAWGVASPAATPCPGDNKDQATALAEAKGQGPSNDIVSVLDSLALAGSGKSTLATTQIARVFTPIGMISTTETFPAVGFDVSASLPVTNATFQDYAKHELLFRRGGLLNMYLSYAGRNPCKLAGEMDSFRRNETDHIYFNRAAAGADKVMGFVSHGIGGRMIKTELPGQSTAGMFSTYLGVGIDAPLFDGSNDNLKKKTPAGVWSLETYLSYNVLNSKTLGRMFNLQDGPRGYGTYGIYFQFNLVDNYQIKLEHMKGLGGFGRSQLGDLTLLTVTYRRAGDSEKGAK